MKVRLTDADRERLGAPEILDLGELARLSVRDAILLEQNGLTWSTGSLATNVLGRVWLALRAEGVLIPAGELDFDIGSMTLLDVPMDEDDPGKASEPDSTSTSPTSDSSTPPTTEATS